MTLSTCDTSQPSYTDQYGSVYDYAASQPDDLYQASDGNWYDDNGTTWNYDSNLGWLKEIAHVTSTPSGLASYVDTYNDINGMNTFLDWFLMLAIGPEEELAAAPSGKIAARFGLEGADFLLARLLSHTLEKIVAENGVNSVYRVTGNEMEAIISKLGYPNAFRSDLEAAQVTSTSANTTGQIAGSQLIHFGPTEQAAISINSSGTGAWAATLSEVTNADGTMMTAAEIQNKFSLPYVPTYYAPVTSIPAGSTIDAGIAGPLFNGDGGGFQYFINNGTIGFGGAVSLP